MAEEKTRAEEQIDHPRDLRARLDKRFRGPLMSFFLRRVHDRGEAEDLTQEVFVRLIGSNSLEKIENADAFVFKVASNLLLDRARRARHRIQKTSLDSALIGEIAKEFVEDRGPERVLLGRQALCDVLAALDELGERTRNIFILFRLENMKQRDIAELYGVSQSTVEKHVMRAVMHLALRFGHRKP